MGEVFATNLAILYMDALETERILTSTNPFHSGIALWKRYIDDIFMIWQDTSDTLGHFLHWLNNNCSRLAFTLSHNKSSISFLDLNIKHTEGKLITSLFRKPTERNTLLRYDSYHPRALRDSLPYSQFLRIRRNCYLKEDYFREAQNLSAKLGARGYPRRLVRNSLKRAWYWPRDVLLEPKNKNTQDGLVCVTTFLPVSHAIRKSVIKHWNTLNAGALNLERPLFAFKKAKNIKDHLVRAALPSKEAKSTLNDHWGLPRLTGYAKCGDCIVCETTLEGKDFVYDKIKFERKYFSNCNTIMLYMQLYAHATWYISVKQLRKYDYGSASIAAGYAATHLMHHWSTTSMQPDTLKKTLNGRL